MWFGCSFNTNDLPREYAKNNTWYQDYQNIITSSLEKYLNPFGELSATKMMEDYFQNVNADVFICHSHNDKIIAENLAVFLYRQLGLRAFVDSMIWGSADSLLRKIDDKFCYNEGKHTYNYKKRNLSTSYVHMMLCSSLANMMDKCICFIFINSNQSIKPSSIDTESSHETFSPWIFFELSLFQKIRKFPLSQSELHKKANLVNENFSSENFKVTFPAETKNLPPLDISVVDKLALEGISGKQALIKLHKMLFPEQYKPTAYIKIYGL